MTHSAEDILGDLIAKTRKAGADAADALLVDATDLSVSLRLGTIENLERSEFGDLGLRVVGLRQRPWIGLAPARAIAVERELVENMRGRGCGVGFGVGLGIETWKQGVEVHSGAFLPVSRAHRGLHGRSLAGGGDGLHPPPARLVRAGQGWSAAEDGSRAAILFRDAKPGTSRRRQE